MKQYGMLIDVYYCTGCHSCEVACEQENSLEAGQFGIKVTEHILKQKQGLMIDYVPYITDLCNFCLGRAAQGRRPSCVKHCQAQCLRFGPIEEVVEAARDSKKPILYFK